MKKTTLALAVGAALIGAALPAAAQQTEGPWMVRVRAVHMGMDNSSDAGNGNLGVDATVLPADAVKVSNKTIPEVDISYFFSKNWAAELVLTVPQKHRVNIDAGALAGDRGGFKHLPPTLTAQYHFTPDATIRPYVGAGINYTRISGVTLDSGLGLEKSSIGPALQAGVDVKLQKNLYLNFDVKKVYIDSDITLNGTKVSHVNLDPLLVGVGLGWRF